MEGQPFAWNTAAEIDGTHAVQAWVRDDAGNAVVTAPFAVVVDNTPPSVALASPAAGALVDGAVQVVAAAQDAIGVAQVGLSASGVSLGIATFTWDTTKYADGPHTLRVRAQDAAGNVGDSATIQVRIANGAGAQLLANTGFEAGPGASWAAKTSSVVNASTAQPAHAGPYKASLCGRGYAYSDYVKQQFNVPAGASKLAVRLWLLVRTSEGLSYAYDRLYVRLYGQSGALVSTLATFSNIQGGTAWVERALTAVDVTATWSP